MKVSLLDNAVSSLLILFSLWCFTLDTKIQYPPRVHHRGTMGNSVLWDYWTSNNCTVVSIVWHSTNYISPTFSLRTQSLRDYFPTPNPFEPRW